MRGTSILTLVGALLAATSEAVALPPRQSGLKFNYGTDKVRGVNLGGWFVLEPWITPSLFNAVGGGAAVDEFSFCQALGPDAAKSRLEQHWSTFITQDDFTRIAQAGFNHVRIPIGYWAITPHGDDPYVQGAYAHLATALDWAQAAGIKVMIDLHGGLYSQNGFDNSGRRGGIGWGTGDSVDQTLVALRQIRDDHAAHPAVSAIELLNEPMGPSIDPNVLNQFYYDGWGNVQGGGVAVTFHDAFKGVTAWNDFGTSQTGWLLDTHHYEVFDQGQLAMSPSAHVGSACGFGGQMTQANKPTIAGEWTGAMTDCALYLNGFGVGARYDGTFNYNGQGSSYMGSCDGKRTGSVSQWSDAERQDTARFVEAQLDAYEKAGGWIFWTWKTEGAPGWDAQDLMANGVLPQPITSRKYPGQCG